MTHEDKALLSAVSEAVLVTTHQIELENYAHWEELIDFVCDLHERLNDMKPAYSTEETPEG